MTPITLLLVNFLVGCRDSTEDVSTEDDSTEDDSTEDDSTEDDSTEDDSTEDDSSEDDEAPDCSDFEGAVMSPEELAATPRRNELAEGMALCMSGGPVVTDDTLYERIAADFATILDTIDEYEREGFYDLPSFSWSDTFPQEMSLSVDGDTQDRIAEGTYHNWDCLNTWYEVESVDADFEPYVDVTFEGFYDLRYLLDEYSALPGVSSIYTDMEEEDWESGTIMRALADGDTMYYGYRAWGGDCPEGCTEFLRLYFISSAAGEVELAGSYVRNEYESHDSTPDWARTLPECVATSRPLTAANGSRSALSYRQQVGPKLSAAGRP